MTKFHSNYFFRILNRMDRGESSTIRKLKNKDYRILCLLRDKMH